MGSKRTLEEALAALRRVREEPEAEASRAELRRIVAGEGAHAVARAAALVGELELEPLAADLVAAFPRFCAGLPKSDPGCTAKTAIVEALRRLGQEQDALYRTAARHVQMEPVFGGRVDTAVDLRGAAALAIAETGRRDVLALLAELLADPEPPVRICAARAVAGFGSDAGVALLKLKALSPDPEPRVVSECLLALLRLDASGQRAFVESFLARSDSLAEAAALALGESRSAEAFEALRGWLPEASRRGLSRMALVAIAALRRDGAIEWLMAMVRDEPATLAREALQALGSLGAETLGARVRTAARARPELEKVLAELFPERSGPKRPAEGH
jgi:HEAT repeat protein